MTIEASGAAADDAARRGGESAAGSAIARFESVQAAPAQARLWLLHQLDPSGLIFHICGVLELVGPLDAAALEFALQSVVARHEPLRTTLHLRGGVLDQQIAIDRTIDLLRDEADPRLGTADPIYQSVLSAQRTRPFRLDRDLMLRGRLVRLGPEKHHLVLAMHHVAVDGWSLGVLVREIAMFYSAHVRGLPPGLPPLPRRYRDYAAEERAAAGSATRTAGIAYWSRTLAGLPPALDLSRLRLRAQAQPASNEAAECSARLSAGQTAALEELARRSGASSFMVLLAAFNLLLHRLTGAVDVCVGTPVANRTRLEHTNLIGLFANTVALRCRIDGDATFEAILRGVKRGVLGAFAHQDVPFDEVAAAIRPGQRADAAPLFNVLFVLQNQPREAGAIDRLELRQLPLERLETELPLIVSILPIHNGLDIRAEYQSRALSAQAVALLLRCFVHLLEEVPLASSARASEFTSLAPLALELSTLCASGPPPALEAGLAERVAPREKMPPSGAAPPLLTPVESQVAAEFASLLGLNTVGADDDFFAKGGHSLLAIQLVARLNRAFAVELPLALVFETPTVAHIAGALQSLASRQQAPVRGLAPRDRASHPLSFAQQRLWVSEQFRPADPYYHVCIAGRVHGKLDAQAFQRALAHIVERHEPLRAVFAEDDGEPSQRVRADTQVEIERISLPGLLPQEADARCRALAEQARLRPFDLERGPLLRSVLVELSELEHAVILTLHHIAWDGWSASVLFRELDAAYEAYAAGRAPGLPPLPARYLDYVYWQHALVAAPSFREHVDYWLHKLAGPPPSPFAKLSATPDAGAGGGSAACVQLGHVPPDQFEALRAVARAHGTTLFTTLLAGFGVLMHREAECTDLCVLTVMAGRSHPDFEGLIGCFVNSCVLRTDMAGDPTLRELLGRFGQTVLDAQVHQQVPFDELLRRLPRRASERGQLPDYCRVLFVLQNAPRAGGVPTFGAVRPFVVEQTTTPFDLVFEITEMNGAADIRCLYRVARFERERIERWMAAYVRILERLGGAAPAIRLTSLARA